MENFAHQMRWLVDEAYPDVPVIRLVLVNLNSHRKASLYETFHAPEARRNAKRLKFHHTPKHGSWLNMAEIEFSVPAREDRNSHRAVDRRFKCGQFFTNLAVLDYVDLCSLFFALTLNSMTSGTFA